MPGKPLQFITGDDGGVVRSDGKFADISCKCDTRGLNRRDSRIAARACLSRVAEPARQHEQRLVDAAVPEPLGRAAQRPQNLLQGGTQDNGTFQYNGSPHRLAPDHLRRRRPVRLQRRGHDALRFNTFTGQANDANFRNGDPTKWVIISAPILSSPEGSFFYPPIIADPNPGRRRARSSRARSRVWRTQDWGGDRDVPRGQLPRVHDVRAASPAAATSSDRPPNARTSGHANSLPACRPYGGNPRVAARSPGSRGLRKTPGTMWAATSTGRVFITDNANDRRPCPSSGIGSTPGDSIGPNRAISAIYVDPTNARHAWISYNGYNVESRPATPGHVSRSTWSGAGAATWVDVSLQPARLPDHGRRQRRRDRRSLTRPPISA